MITIVTATRNAAATLPALIASLRAQTDRDFEWRVADGASTDGTQALLEGAADVLAHWTSEPDFGIYDAINKAVRGAGGEHYLVVGADDTLEPRAIEHFAHAVAESGADIVSAPVWAGGLRIEPRRRCAWLRSGPPGVSAHSVGTLIRRSLHDEIGPYSARYPIAADTLFLLQARRLKKRFAYIEPVAGHFGAAGVSSRDTLGALCESFRANVEVDGRLWLHTMLLLARIVANRARITAGLAHER